MTEAHSSQATTQKPYVVRILRHLNLVAVILLAIAVYFGAYVVLGDVRRYDEQTTRTTNIDTVERSYSSGWLAEFFQPATAIERVVTQRKVEIRYDRSQLRE